MSDEEKTLRSILEYLGFSRREIDEHSKNATLQTHLEWYAKNKNE